ncbi:MAG: co-chaperone GroES [Dehalococcoidia bacterium]
MGRQFEPLGDGVVIKPTEREEVTASGIVLPDTAQEKPQEGEVIAVGPGRVSDDGKRTPMEVKKGDKVLFRKYSGTEVKEGDVEYLIVKESDIVARIR